MASQRRQGFLALEQLSQLGVWLEISSFDDHAHVTGKLVPGELGKVVRCTARCTGAQ